MLVLLWPLSVIYSLVVSVRNFLFDKGIFKQTSVPVRVVSVGNLSMGGTGKTPVVAHIVRHLLSVQKKVAIVSRGYKGAYKADATKVDDERADASAIYGDEPVWLSKSLKVPVYVGRRRVKAAQAALAETPDVIIADDGFQHRWLSRDYDIVLIDALDRAMTVVPHGRLREPLGSLKRADTIFVTKSNMVSTAEKERLELNLSSYGFSLARENLFYVSYSLSRHFELLNRGRPRLELGNAVYLLSGIAQPKGFRLLLESKYKVLAHKIGADHHCWSGEDLRSILDDCKKRECQHILTTGKDSVKLKELVASDNSMKTALQSGGEYEKIAIWVMPLQLNIEPELDYEKFI